VELHKAAFVEYYKARCFIEVIFSVVRWKLGTAYEECAR
jgi:hypothetical protein